MRAIGNYLVIQEIKEKPTKTEGGLLLTDKIKEDIRYRQGIVKSVGSLVQGALESSNVNVVQELVDMIETQRAYEVNSKAISGVDDMLRFISQNL